LLVKEIMEALELQTAMELVLAGVVLALSEVTILLQMEE
jgi:hypothetical protein